jgi:hypothetical protein
MRGKGNRLNNCKYWIIEVLLYLKGPPLSTFIYFTRSLPFYKTKKKKNNNVIYRRSDLKNMKFVTSSLTYYEIAVCSYSKCAIIVHFDALGLNYEKGIGFNNKISEFCFS